MTTTLRGVSAAAIAAVLACVALLAGPLAMPAQANDFEVYNLDDFYAAIDDVNEFDGSHTINIRADLDFSGESKGTLTENFGIPAKDVTIEGNDFTVSCEESCDRWLQVELGTNASLTIRDLTVTGFRSGAIITGNTHLTVIGVNFSHNAWIEPDLEWVEATGGAITDYSSDNSVIITVTDSYFDYNYARGGNARGGAIYSHSDLDIDNTIFEGNYVYATAGYAEGGAIYLKDAQAQIEDSTFLANAASDEVSNEATGVGGAIAVESGAVEAEDVEFTENWVSNGGGAVVLGVNSWMGIADSLFDDNFTESGPGGAIWAQHGTAFFTANTTFESNYANDGGAVYLYDAYSELYDVTFRDNHAVYSGGAVYLGGDDVETDWSVAWITNATFVENTAFYGGALGLHKWADAIVYNATFTQNVADDGAAIEATYSYVDLSHVTIAANTPRSAYNEGNGGGQIWLEGSEVGVYGTVIVDAGTNRVNCVGDDYSDLDLSGYNASDDESCFINSPWSVADPGFDAMLGPLQFNGGPTWTMLPEPGSPLIDAWEAGGQDGCEAETSDQRGVFRPQNGKCDIGAVETFPPIYREVETPGGTVWVMITNAVDADDVEYVDVAGAEPAAPAGVTFPYGAQAFDIDVYDDGWPAEIWIWSPAPTNQLWKLFDGEWVNPPGARSRNIEGGTEWRFRVFDGGWGDNDFSANSRIIDPVSMGIVAAFTG